MDRTDFLQRINKEFETMTQEFILEFSGDRDHDKALMSRLVATGLADATVKFILSETLGNDRGEWRDRVTDVIVALGIMEAALMSFAIKIAMGPRIVDDPVIQGNAVKAAETIGETFKADIMKRAGEYAKKK
jgi:hypothetical protein